MADIRVKTYTNFFWKFLEQTLGQFVSLVVSIVLARILLPEDYGVVTVVLIFIAVCDVFISQGFASALIQKKEVDDKDYSSMFYASLALSFFLYAILFFTAPFIQSFFGSQYKLLCPILRVMGLQIPISAVKAIQQAVVSRNLQFKKFFWATLGGKCFSAIIGIWMALEGMGAWALAGQSLSCCIVDTLILSLIVKWRPILYFSWVRIKSMISFGSKLVLAGLVDTLYNKLRSFVIGKQYNPADLAFYEKGDQFPSLLMNTTNSSLMAVLFPVMSKFQDDNDSVLQVCRRSVKVCTYILFPIMAILALVSEDLICVLLTDKWIECVPYAQIFCAVYAFYPIYTVNIQAIKAVGKGGAYLILEIAKKVTGILCLVVAIPYGIMWIALSLLIATFINYIINGVAAKLVLGYGYRQQVIDILPNVLIVAIMTVVVYFLPDLLGSRLINLIITLFIGIVLYWLISFFTRNENYLYLVSFVRESRFFKHDK